MFSTLQIKHLEIIHKVFQSFSILFYTDVHIYQQYTYCYIKECIYRVR